MIKKSNQIPETPPIENVKPFFEKRSYIHDDIFNILPKLENELKTFKNFKGYDLIVLDTNFGGFSKGNKKANKFSDVLSEDQLKRLMRTLKKLLSDVGTLVVFGQDEYTFEFYNILPNMYRYSLVWKKGNKVTQHLNASKRPLSNHSDIMIFQHISKPDKNHIYNPQFTKGAMRYASLKGNGYKQKQDNVYGELKPIEKDTDQRYPTTILDFPPDVEQYIPLQKPQSLMDWIVLTYSNSHSAILDPCMGSGTLGISAKKYNRYYVGVEINDEVFKIAKDRVENFAITKNII